MLRSFLLLILGANFAWCMEECESDLPSLPKFYKATIQYNIKTDDRYTLSGCKQLGRCGQLPWNISTEEPKPKAGKSIVIEEAVDDVLKAAYIIAGQEVNINMGDETKPFIMTEKVVWNDELSGYDEFLEHIWIGDKMEYCMADSIHEGGPMDLTFGFLCQWNSSHCGHPSVAGMLHSLGCWTKTGNKMIVRGVAVEEYKLSDDGMTMLYYWSDPEKWMSSDGRKKSVPIMMKFDGIPPGEEFPLLVELDYQDFFEVQLEKTAYNAPEYLYCQGRNPDLTIPHMFPDHYKFGSELVLVHAGEGETAHKLISTRQEWYDFSFNLSRVDYKPYDKDHPLDPLAGDDQLVTEILDFNVLIQYVIDKRSGNCTVEQIKYNPFSPNPGDISIDEHGHIHMMSPIHFFHMDRKFAFNGEFYDRGIKMNAFATSYTLNPDEPDKNVTVVVYTSSSDYTNIDGGNGEIYVPTKIIQYPNDEQHILDWRVRQTYDIFHFSKSEDGFQDFDVSSCYKDDEKKRLSISFPLISEVDLQAAVRVLIRISNLLIAEVGNIAPIRIQHIETLVFEDEGFFDLVFTIVEPPPLPEGADVPSYYTSTNKEVMDALLTSVDSNSFILLMLDANEELRNITAIAGSLKEVDSAGGGNPGGLAGKGTNVEYTQGYTSGAMAGLAFGMIFLGILVAGTVYMAFFRNNVRSGMPVLRGIDNPLAGLTNLGK